MPMDFPDMESLRIAANVHRFRKLNKGETEIHYRNVLADHVSSIDYIESEEIRNSVGWDKFSTKQKEAMLKKRGL